MELNKFNPKTVVFIDVDKMVKTAKRIENVSE